MTPPPSPADPDRTAGDVRFARFAWGALAYTILVILWGGFVRASGSGAGCGDHWPLCNGEVVPQAPALSTLIELTHRVTSGIALPLVVVLLVWAWRRFERGAFVRRAAAWSVVFMVTEALIGAGLVLFEYVAYNPSIARAYWMAAHLANTFLLLAAMGLTAWTASTGLRPRWRGGRLGAALAAALGGTLVLGTSGAVTALGDTLTLGGGLDPASDPVVATLVGLRIYHPLLACVVLLLVAGAALVVRSAAGRGEVRPTAARLGAAVVALFLAQMGVGVVNVLLQAPIWLQLVHLLVTDAIWLGLVVFAAEALAMPDPHRPGAAHMAGAQATSSALNRSASASAASGVVASV